MEQNPENKDQQEIKLDRKSKIFFILLAVLIVGSVAVTYYRYMVKRDYIIQAQIDCDPTTEKCFIWKCDPKSLTEGEECTGVPDNDTWYYKLFYRNAKYIPDCDPKDKDCTAYVCGDGEKDCREELCSSKNVPKGETCNDPVQYNIDNPPDQSSSDESCAPDDTECQAAKDSSDSSEQCDPANPDCQNAQPDASQDPAANSADQNTDSNGDSQASPVPIQQ